MEDGSKGAHLQNSSMAGGGGGKRQLLGTTWLSVGCGNVVVELREASVFSTTPSPDPNSERSLSSENVTLGLKAKQ